MWLRRRHSHLLTGLLALCFLAAAIAVWQYYLRQRAAIEDAAVHEMSAIRDIETIQIHNWRQERLADGGLLLSLAEMNAAKRILSGAGSDSDRAQILSLMGALKRTYGYDDVTLVDKDGQTYARLEDGATESRVKQSQRVALAREAREPTLSDIEIDRSGERLITLTVPAGSGGSFILQIDPKSFLDPYLKSWRSANRTGETYLVRREPEAVVYLTQLRFGNGSALWQRPVRASALPQEDRLPEAWVKRGPDYHGVQVMLCARRVPGSRWFLLVKKDLAEIDEPLTRLGWQLGAALMLIAVTCLAGVGWIWKSHQLRMQQESEDRLRLLNEELAVNLQDKTAKEAEIRGLSARLIHAHEEERRRLSRELHDDLSQQIAALSIGMGNLKRGMPKENLEQRAHCDKLQQCLIDVSESVRRMSHELHPTVMQHSGLAAALRGYCREFEELSGVRVGLRIEGDCGDVTPDVALTVFRIVQESLRNIARHAGVKRAEVDFTRLEAEVQLLVTDEGIGLPPDSSAKTGLGLISMRERTRLVNGTIDVKSAPGQGTRICVRIPIEIRDGKTQTASRHQ